LEEQPVALAVVSNQRILPGVEDITSATERSCLTRPIQSKISTPTSLYFLTTTLLTTGIDGEIVDSEYMELIGESVIFGTGIRLFV
jgi:hypothetical protein